MKKLIRNIIYFLLTVVLFYSCTKTEEDEAESIPLKPISTQYVVENDSIIEFMKTHFYNYDDFTSLSSNSTVELIIDTISGDNINKTPLFDQVTTMSIDIPMMFGYKVFGLANIFAGPRFEFIRGVSYDNIDLDDLKNQYNLGLQYGIGLKFGKFEFDLRAERGFTKNEINFMENQAEIKNQYITSQGRLYLLGVSYYF